MPFYKVTVMWKNEIKAERSLTKKSTSYNIIYIKNITKLIQDVGKKF